MALKSQQPQSRIHKPILLSNGFAFDFVDEVIQTCAYAFHTIGQSNCLYSSAQMAFGMDTLFHEKCIIKWLRVEALCLKQTQQNNNKETHKWLQHIYNVSDLVLIVSSAYDRHKQVKLSSSTEGPYAIIRVYQNCTLCIHGGNFKEIISIRCLQTEQIRAHFLKL